MCENKKNLNTDEKNLAGFIMPRCSPKRQMVAMPAGVIYLRSHKEAI